MLTSKPFLLELESFKQLATVNHQGTVIAFARDQSGAIQYNALALNADSLNDNMDWTGFSELPFQSSFVLPVQVL